MHSLVRDRSNKDAVADQIFIIAFAYLRVALVMHDERPDDWHTGAGLLVEQIIQIRNEPIS